MDQSLSQYILNHLEDKEDVVALSQILLDVALVGKYLSAETNRVGLGYFQGMTGEQNVQGESVQKLDEFANDVCKHVFGKNQHIALLASEEEESVVPVFDGKELADYIIAFDPLDGSNNIDVNVSVGTIFSVHKKRDDVALDNPAQFFQTGSEQVLAGYLLYGSSTVLVFSFGRGVIECTLDPVLGEFLVSKEQVQLPETPVCYSVNESNLRFMHEKDQQYIKFLRDESGMTARYIGSFVADFHRNLLKDGVFLYPRVDKKGEGVYKGKLRLNYELKPLAFLLSQAGGLAVDQRTDILDITPASLHERRGICMGNRDVVEGYRGRWG